MKLKKWMFTLVALLATSSLFAGNTSDLKQLIGQFFLTLNYQADMLAYEDADTAAKLSTASRALQAGLLKYEEDLTAGNLTGKSQDIHKHFDSLVPIFNKIQDSSEEIAEEVMPIITNLTNDIIGNQTTISATGVDTETAEGLMYVFIFTKLISEGEIRARVSTILTQEMMMSVMMGAGQE